MKLKGTHRIPRNILKEVITPNYLTHNYIDKRKSVKIISSELHVSKFTIYKYLKLYNIALKKLECSEDTKKKISIANKGYIPWNKGIPRSQRTKNTISIKNKQRYSTPTNCSRYIDGRCSSPRYCIDGNTKIRRFTCT